MNELASFSDWVLAVLPRLFVYPGGAWMLAALLILRFILGGRKGISPPGIIYNLSRAHLLSLALAWTALSLASLPGASMLTFPADRLVLAGLLAASLALEQLAGDDRWWYEALCGVAITLALVAPLAGGRSLLATGDTSSLAAWLSAFAVSIGLAALAPTVRDSLAGGVRWLAWLGVALAPLWSQPYIAGVVGASIAYLLLIALLAALGKATYARDGRARLLLAITWGLAALALLAALLT